MAGQQTARELLFMPSPWKVLPKIESNSSSAKIPHIIETFLCASVSLEVFGLCECWI